MDNEDSPRTRRAPTKPSVTDTDQNAGQNADQGATDASPAAAAAPVPHAATGADGRERPIVGGSFIRAKDGTIQRAEA